MKIDWKRLFCMAACVTLCASSVAVQGAVTARADGIVSDEYAISFYSGESSFSYYIDGEGTLYASGNNGNGEFGDGTKNVTRYTPSKVMKNVETVADGKSGFALALTKSGALYGWGNNKYSQLGQGTPYNSDSETNCVLVPQEITISGNAKISALAAGESFSVVLTEDGEVYTCGRAGDGQTGIAGLTLSRTAVVGTFTKIDQSYFGGEKVTAIDAAENTGFALTESGTLYIWGANDKGLLGNGSVDENEIYETPLQLDFEEKITAVSAETMTALILTESGRVYAWGDNSVGQLGSAEYTDVSSGTPVLIGSYYDADGNEVAITPKAILAGGRTNFVLSEEGNVYAFGAAGQGQAGCNLQSEVYLTHPCVENSNVVRPMQIRFYEAVSLENAEEETLELYKDKIPVNQSNEIGVEIETLVNSIGDRTFVTDSEGNMWSWGINLYAMACSGDAYDCTVPVRSTLYRKENYDTTYTEKNYMLTPAIVMGCVAAFAVFWFVRAEIKLRRSGREQA